MSRAIREAIKELGMIEEDEFMDKIDLNQLAMSVQYVVCKSCNVERKKFKNGTYPNAKDFRFVDEKNREWSGRTCPQCHSDNNAKRQQSKRDKKKLYV